MDVIIDEAGRLIGSSLSDFKILCELGKGSYGLVYKVQSQIDNNIYVIKKMELKHMKEKQQNEAWKEVMILKKVNHSNIIKYYTSFLEDDNLYIVMEYAEGGDLYSHIKKFKKQGKIFTEDELWYFTYQILVGLDYLHSNNIIHRDIKCLNLFLTKGKIVKIGDLGVSKIVSHINALHCSRVGTPLYLSPELIKQIPYDYKVDMWSLGCSLYHLANLDPPFGGDNLITLGNNIVKTKHKQISHVYSKDFSNLIDRLLNKKAEKRPTSKEALACVPMYIIDKFTIKKYKSDSDDIKDILISNNQIKSEPKLREEMIVNEKKKEIAKDFNYNKEIEILENIIKKPDKKPEILNENLKSIINIEKSISKIDPQLHTSSNIFLKNNKNDTSFNRTKSFKKDSNHNQIRATSIIIPQVENKDSIVSEYLDNFEDIKSIKPLKQGNRILSARLEKPVNNQFRPNTASMNRVEKIPKIKPNRPLTAINKDNKVINININFYKIDVKDNRCLNATPVKNLLYINKNDEFMEFKNDIKSRPQTGKFKNYLLNDIKSSNFVFKEILKNMEVNQNCSKKLTINDLRL